MSFIMGVSRYLLLSQIVQQILICAEMLDLNLKTMLNLTLSSTWSNQLLYYNKCIFILELVEVKVVTHSDYVCTLSYLIIYSYLSIGLYAVISGILGFFACGITYFFDFKKPDGKVNQIQ